MPAARRSVNGGHVAGAHMSKLAALLRTMSFRPRRWSMLQGSLLVFGSYVVTFVLSVPNSIMLARALRPTGRGEYALLLLVPGLLSLLCDPGYGTAAVYFLGRRRFSAGLLAAALLAAALGCGAIGLAAIALLLQFPTLLPAIGLQVALDHTALLWLSALTLPCAFATNYYAALLLAEQRLPSYNLVQILPYITQLLLVAGLLVAGQLTLTTAVGTFVAAKLLTALVCLALVVRHSPPQWRGVAAVLSAGFVFGMQAYLSRVLVVLGWRFDEFMIAALLTHADVGIYNVGVAFAERVWLVSTSVALVLYPYIAASHPDDAARVTSDSCRHTLLLIGLLTLGVALVIESVIAWAFGPAYRAAGPMLLVLLPGVLAVSLGGILQTYLIGRGRPALGIVPTLISIVINVAGNLLLVPRLGIMGAAFGSTLAYVVSTGLLLRAYLRLSGARLADIFVLRPADFVLYRGLLRAAAARVGYRGRPS